MAKRKKPTTEQSAATEIPPEIQESVQDEVTSTAQQLEESQRSRSQEMRLEMMRSVITEPLLSKVFEERKNKKGEEFDVIISLNEFYWKSIAEALKEVEALAEAWGEKYTTVSNYCFARLSADRILELADLTLKQQAERPQGNIIYRIWEDSDVSITLTQSLTTVKADAAQRAFHAHGDGIVWAVLDSGVNRAHDHFNFKDAPFGPVDSLNVRAPLAHLDFTPDGQRTGADPESAAIDRLGHGTHVAGIIAGYWRAKSADGDLVAGTEIRNPQNENSAIAQRDRIREISGVAPKCKIVSLKVIADKTVPEVEGKQTEGQGKVSWVLRALDQIQTWNQHGKRLLVHGVNMSLGYEFNARWFACGQSPLCVEVDRLVKSGVAVVVSAGNSGYSSYLMQSGKAESRYSGVSITDPGNAELAITVGSTHKQAPHMYGVSYFSSRGPTGDGRPKPDMLAPGERIISCAAGKEAAKYGAATDREGNPVTDPVLYCEQTGTSMAAPHVSGALAAFLSVRPEFVGQPERVKQIFMANAIDLRRERSFQGSGLLDLMKVLQAV